MAFCMGHGKMKGSFGIFGNPGDIRLKPNGFNNLNKPVGVENSELAQIVFLILEYDGRWRCCNHRCR